MAHHTDPSSAALERMRADDASGPLDAGYGGPSLGLLWLLIPLIVSAGGVAALVALTLAGIVASVPGLVPLGAVCGAVYLGVRHRPRSVPTSSTPWSQARDRFRTLATAYAGYECDPVAVLTRPALSDVSVPSTARFVDAFAQAQALDTDAFPGSAHADTFVRAVAHAERAWRAAQEAAERIGDQGWTPAQRRVVERVRTLLALARSTDNPAERAAAWTRARAHLLGLDRAGAIHLPRPARAALDTASRPELTA